MRSVPSAWVLALAIASVSVPAVRTQGLVPAARAAEPVPPDSIVRLCDVEGLPLLWPGVTCRQFASTDPTGRGEDHGHFLRFEGNTAVLAEMDGPGVVVRLWSANAQGRLRVFLDGEAEPRIDGPFQDLFTGKLPPFCEPIAIHKGGGWISYFPIPYSKSCRIEVAELERPRDLYYQVQYLTYPAGTPMRTFTKELPPDEQKALGLVIRYWRRETPFLRHESLRPPTKKVEPELTIPPGETRSVECEGPATIVSFSAELRAAGKDDRTDPAARRGLLLEIAFDGAPPTVRAPLAAFFGGGFGQAGAKGALLSWGHFLGTCTLPMPFRKQARISLHNSLPTEQRVRVTAWTRLGEPAANAGTLHAEFRCTDRVGQEPYEFAHIDGPGKYVGITQALQGVGDLWYLEGNEQFFVDGEQRPSILGTGTEDFYNGGWYWDSGPFQLPLHGLSEKAEWTTNRTAPWRMQMVDAVPFEKGLVARIEHGSRNEVRDAYYSSVAYWYGPPRPVREVPDTELREPRQWVVRPKGFAPAASLRWENEPPVVWQTWQELTDTHRGLDRPLYQAFPVSYVVADGQPIDPRLAVLAPGKEPLTYRAYVTVPFADRFAIQLRGRLLGSLTAVVVDGERIRATPYSPQITDALQQLEIHPRPWAAGEHEIGFLVAVRRGPAPALDSLRLVPQAPFVRAWWVAPPVRARAGGTVEDVMPEEKVFLAADFDPAAAGWEKVRADGDGLDLNRAVSPDAPVLAYLCVFVHAPAARTAHALLGSDDGVRVWANGDLVWSHAIHRPMSPDQDEFDVPLRAGWNRLVLKVKNDDGGYGVMLRLADPDGTLRIAHEPGG